MTGWGAKIRNAGSNKRGEDKKSSMLEVDEERDIVSVADSSELVPPLSEPVKKQNLKIDLIRRPL